MESRPSPHQVLLPPGWPRPKGYSNGVLAKGALISVGGQIGWDQTGTFAPTFVGQVAQALRNITAVLAEADAGPQHIVRLTWYVTDLQQYGAALKEIGVVYREIIGQNYPSMSVVQITALVEPAAMVEIEATAVV
jgi:enamine deaminase RidA (YjgF/YER057c/UK114 family)